MNLCDAHNHLQDERFDGRQGEILEACRAVGIERMVVNGSCEQDWPAVAELARRWPDVVVPAFGLHPWYVHERTSGWRDGLRRYLRTVPGAVVGEIGLDRWVLECSPAARAAVSSGLVGSEVASLAEQEDVFVQQLAIARELGVSASVHCLQAWGPLMDALRGGPRPERGFLLHSYGGPVELVRPLARLGGYFGFPGYFLHARKARQRSVFREVPADRLLVETDAPDQRLPMEPEWLAGGTGETEADPTWADWRPRVDRSASGADLNHPANLILVYRGLAQIRGEDGRQLAATVAVNFARLFTAADQGEGCWGAGAGAGVPG